MSYVRKIINDPVYGFITIDDPLIFEIISHPYYQRLRRIHQMAFASMVFPGAEHTRLHHSLGSYHLICLAIRELKAKGVEITKEEETGTQIAILLHDIGHGPYSHALEKKLIKEIDHEALSLLILQLLNEQFKGKLQLAINIFQDKYSKHFLHQLVSGQLDVDRMDYLTRDSFYTGVVEGAIGYDRILKMLTVHGGELMIEEKAIYTVEKFLVSRRLMYWQVYLHKTVLTAEKMLIKIIERAKKLLEHQVILSSGSENLDYFLKMEPETNFIPHIEKFAMLDDYDILCAIKNWCGHFDKILSMLCKGVVNRKLLRAKIQAESFDEDLLKKLKQEVSEKYHISYEEADYFVLTGEAINTTYNPFDEHIKVLFKNGDVTDISGVDNALIHHTLSSPVKKYYLCYPR